MCTTVTFNQRWQRKENHQSAVRKHRSRPVIVAAVPWARHGAGHTHQFDAQVAWLATKTSKTAACELMRIAWRTVGAIITRVWDDTAKLTTSSMGSPGSVSTRFPIGAATSI